MSPSEITATSLVPPPISATMLPEASATGSPAPIAAAIGFSIRLTYRAPALFAASCTALRSTSVTPDGMHIITRALPNGEPLIAFFIKRESMSAVMSKSAITPSLSGFTAVIEPGVRPIICFASLPTATTFGGFALTSTATTDGSRTTIPLFFTHTSVLAVPRSMPKSTENNIK